jgi:hypothetical protein
LVCIIRPKDARPHLLHFRGLGAQDTDWYVEHEVQGYRPDPCLYHAFLSRATMPVSASNAVNQAGFLENLDDIDLLSETDCATQGLDQSDKVAEVLS